MWTAEAFAWLAGWWDTFLLVSIGCFPPWFFMLIIMCPMGNASY
jgi:hypothetical protein